MLALVLPRLGAAVYGVMIIGGLLWQGLRGISRLSAVVDYLELRERRFPQSVSMPPPPLARQAPMPYGVIAVAAAGLALTPLVIGLATSSVGIISIVVGSVAAVAAAAIVMLLAHSPWAETRRLVWEAASSEGTARVERLEEALDADPQLQARGVDEGLRVKPK